MENIRYDLITALPEIVIVCMAMFILLADLFLKPANRIAIYLLAQVTLLVAAYITFTTHVPSVSYAFTNTFVDDAMSDVLKLMIYLGTSLIFVYSRQYLQQRDMYRGEFYALYRPRAIIIEFIRISSA
jgi:NADH-quinone oxidoreductase subunit N